MTNHDVKTVLQAAKQALAAISTTADLDAEILLAHVLQRSRSFFLAHTEFVLTSKQMQELQALLARRSRGEPIAYILGHQEFWSLSFKVDSRVLIPRPETELLVEVVLQHYAASAKLRMADLGTGCGALALALASERPEWEIVAADKSKAALELAEENAGKLDITNVSFQAGEWCQALTGKFDLIISNPPYIAADDPHLSVLKYEPQEALVSGADGLDDIGKIIAEARSYLINQGVLMLEHGFDQAEKVRALMAQYGYLRTKSYCDLLGHERVTSGMV